MAWDSVLGWVDLKKHKDGSLTLTPRDGRPAVRTGPPIADRSEEEKELMAAVEKSLCRKKKKK